MRLNRNLGRQWMSAEQLAGLHSMDFGVPMHQVADAMQKEWDSGIRGHMTEDIHGGPKPYVQHLMEDIAKNGMKKPIRVSGEVVVDGHHRALAAMALGMEKVPVRLV